MNFQPADLPGTITALATLLTAVGTLIFAWKSNQKAQEAKVNSGVAAQAAVEVVAAVVEVDKKVSANTELTTKVAEDVVLTKNLADGNLTRALSEIDRLRQIVEAMRDAAPGPQTPTGPGRQAAPKDPKGGKP
jgi:hypothetical protein